MVQANANSNGLVPARHSVTENDAALLDKNDQLAHFKDRFLLPDGVYLDGTEDLT